MVRRPVECRASNSMLFIRSLHGESSAPQALDSGSHLRHTTFATSRRFVTVETRVFASSLWITAYTNLIRRARRRAYRRQFLHDCSATRKSSRLRQHLTRVRGLSVGGANRQDPGDSFSVPSRMSVAGMAVFRDHIYRSPSVTAAIGSRNL